MINKELWNEIIEMFNNSTSKIKLVSAEENIGESIVSQLGLNKATTLSTIICNVSGITVDNIIRIIGQGNQKMIGVDKINAIVNGKPSKIRDMLIIGTDIFGGIYAMNMTEINGVIGNIFYFAPDTLAWESMDMKYSQFLYWTVHGNVNEFYSSMKWNGWEQIAVSTGFNEGILVYPFLWSKEINIETASKKIVPFEELININMEYRNKFF